MRLSQFHFLTSPHRLWLLLPLLALLALSGRHGEPQAPLVQSEAAPAAFMAPALALPPADPDTMQAEATPQAIPWSELGAHADKQATGDALAVEALADGSARLETRFQRLAARVETGQGLAIHSTREQDAEERGAPLRVVADAIGRTGGAAVAISRHGMVAVDERHVRWERPGLTEEYSVSVDGLRQDFLLATPPAGAGELRLELAVAGARAHQADDGVRLQLDSGRKLAYSRLHVEDANGQVLSARMEVVAADRIVLAVNDAEAVYPIRIDPTFSDESGWAKSFFAEIGTTITVTAFAADNAGNTYIAGNFSSSTDTVEMVLGDVTLVRIGTTDAVVAKIDSSGAVLWAKNFGGSGATTYAQAIAVDSAGSVSLGGYFQSANLTIPALTKIGTNDAFVIQLDAGGETNWAKNFGGSGASAYANGIAVGGDGNVSLGGYFQSADLATPALTKIGTRDIFVIQLDAAGNTSWAKNFGGSGAYAATEAIAIDGDGNVSLGGYFQSANLTTPALTRIGTTDAFVIQLDAGGDTNWAKNFGGSGAYTHARAIAVDSAGNVSLSGHFSSANLTTPVLARIGTTDAFVIQIDAGGDTNWAKNFGGSGTHTYAAAITVDGVGNVSLSGHFSSANLTTPALTKIGNTDGLAIQLDAAGNINWAQNFGGSGANAYARGIAVDGAGNMSLGGYFLNADLTTPPLARKGKQDALVLRLSSSDGSVENAWNYGGLSASPMQVMATAADTDGNSYVAGYFSGQRLTLGSSQLTGIGTRDAVVAKMDATGAVLWAKNFGGSGARAYGHAITVDGAGNVSLSGVFDNANLTTPWLPKIGNVDAFAIQLDAAGNINWAKNFGGTEANAYALAIAVDGAGNVTLGGSFTANLTTPALTKTGVQDAFAIKLDMAGNINWVRKFGGSGAYAVADAIAVDSIGNVSLVGHFSSANLTTPALAKIGNVDVLAIQLDAAGNINWAKNFGGSGASTSVRGVAVDSAGNVSLGGYFGNADLSTPALTRIGSTDAFVLQLDAMGSINWAKNFGGSGASVLARGIAVDGAGTVSLGGHFDSADLTTPVLTKIGSTDAFVLQIDATGNTLDANNFGGSEAEAYALAIATDGAGTVSLGGYLKKSSLTSPVLTLSSGGSTDGFLLRYSTRVTVTPVAGIGGSIEPSSVQSIAIGSTSSFTVTPDTGYSIVSVSGCEGSLSGDTYTTGTIIGACSIEASFSLNSYTVSATSNAGGSISPASQSVDHGSITSFAVTPDEGYTVVMGGSCGGSLSGSSYTTSAITAACTVTAQFEPIFTLEDGDGQALGDQELLAGDTVTFSVTNGSGDYEVMAGANANGVSGTLQDNGDGSYSFIAPTTGAFAGDYLITVTDTVSGWSEQFTISVPLKISLSRYTLLSLGERNTAVVTVTGAVAGQAITLSVAGDELSLLPQSDDTGMVAAADPANGNPATGSVTAQHSAAAVGFDVVASAGGYPQGQVSVQVLPAIAYAGNVSSPTATPVQALVELRITVGGNTSTLKDELDEPFAVTADIAGDFLLYGPDDGDYSLRFTVDGYASHSVAAASCEVTTPCLVVLDYEQTTAAPELSPAGGSYVGEVAITLTTTTVDATLVYTLGGTTPSRSHGEVVENGATVSLNASTTLHVMAWKDGLNDSEVVTADYIITATVIPVGGGGGGGTIGPAWLLFILVLMARIRTATYNAVRPFATRCNVKL